MLYLGIMMLLVYLLPSFLLQSEYQSRYALPVLPLLAVLAAGSIVAIVRVASRKLRLSPLLRSTITAAVALGAFGSVLQNDIGYLRRIWQQNPGNTWLQMYQSLPVTADATGTTNMSGTGGKVVAVRPGTSLGLACNGSSDPCDAAETARIADLVPDAERFESVAAGMMSLPISRKPRDYVILFRSERVRSVRERRDTAAAIAAISALESAAAGTENLLPHILTAVEAQVTVGEISHALRRVWGEYQESVTV